MEFKTNKIGKKIFLVGFVTLISLIITSCNNKDIKNNKLEDNNDEIIDVVDIEQDVGIEKIEYDLESVNKDLEALIEEIYKEEDFEVYQFNKDIVGAKIPSFSLFDIEGNSTELKQLVSNNKPYLVKFMGTWCGGCEDVTKDLIEVKKKTNIDIIPITLSSSPEEIKEFKDRTGSDMDYYLSGNELEPDSIGIFGVPTILLVDKNGIIQAAFMNEDADIMIKAINYIK